MPTLHDDDLTAAQIADMLARADAFRETVREAIETTTVDPSSLFAVEKREALDRITATLDAVPDVMLLNLATVDAMLRGGVMMVLRVKLMACGGGPMLDFADATTFLNELHQPLIETVRNRRIN